MDTQTKHRFTMAGLFGAPSRLLRLDGESSFPRGVITITDFAEYLSCATTSTASLSNRSLAWMSDICFLQEGETDADHLDDLRDCGIGPKEVHHIQGGLIMAVLTDPEKRVLKLIAEKLRDGFILRLFHPIPQAKGQEGLGPEESNKHNDLLIKALQEELGWSSHEIWNHLVFNNKTTSPGAELNHSKAEQRRKVRSKLHLPYRIIRPTAQSIRKAQVAVKKEFFDRYGFHIQHTRLKAVNGASGDEQYSSASYTPAEMMAEILARQKQPASSPLGVAAKMKKFIKRKVEKAQEQVVTDEYLLVPNLTNFVDLSLSGLTIDTDDFITHGLKRGYHPLGVTVQCNRLDDSGKHWCGNIQLIPGMLIHPGQRDQRGRVLIPELRATAAFMESLVNLVSAYMDEQYKAQQLTGMSSVDLGCFYNPASGEWELVVFEVNPRPTNGTTLCELMWQVDARLRDIGSGVPDQLTGALLILKVPKESPLTYQEQRQLLGEDFLAQAFPGLGAIPIVPTSWGTEGQVVYAFFAKDPIELMKLIYRVWQKLEAKTAPDILAILEHLGIE